MASDHDIETLLATSDTFRAAPEVPATWLVEDIMRAIMKYSESGVPCVITGLSEDQNNEQSPFRQSTQWMESIYASQASNMPSDAHRTWGTHNTTGVTIPSPPEWVTWLQESFIVPSYLTPRGGNDLLPAGVQSISLKLFGPKLDTLFQDDSCSTFAHDLLCNGGTDAVKYWFMTAARDWVAVTDYMRARDGSNMIRAHSMSPQEFSEAPFTVYSHVQRKGDLVILPPRSFSQTVHRGITASLCWEWMTLQALESFIFHDMIFKQRICARIRHRPHQALCDAVLELYAELSDLKQSQPNDLASLSAKSRSLGNGLRLLDEVISFSHCLQDDDIPLIELTPPPPCSFCGGELFRSFFRCTASCSRDDAADESSSPKILICNLCFVDGRACSCGSMEPYRLQPLAELTDLREKVASLLDSIGESDFPRSNQGDQRCSIFSSANALCGIKSSKNSEVRRCTLRTTPSHDVPDFSTISCKLCHSGRCYQHILKTFTIHSALALKAHLADKTSKRWHRLHLETKDAYARDFAQLKDAIKNGSSYSLPHRLVYYASNFASATPLSQAVVPGFYDLPDAQLKMTGSTAPLRRTGSKRAPNEGSQPGGGQRLLRRSSTAETSTVGEGSGLRKRPLNPREEGVTTNKRTRTSGASEPRTSGTHLEGTRQIRELRRNPPRKGRSQEPGNLREESPTDVSSSEGGGDNTRGQESNEKPDEDNKPPSPLNQPLTFFDPDTDLHTTDPGSSRLVYRSALGELLGDRTTPISQHLNQASPIDTAIYEPVEATLTQRLSPVSSTTPQRQPQSRIKQQFHTHGSLQYRSDSFTQMNRTRQDTPIPHQRPSASSQRQPDQGASSTHFPTSSFSFRAPNLASHPVSGVRRDGRDPRSPPAEYISESRGAAQSIRSSNQATGPKRPRRKITGNALSAENLLAYAEILQDPEEEWEAAPRAPGNLFGSGRR